ncbi:MAG: zf-TFIIB domain-containing protein [Candidatus Aenigmatarchaeota archaeon]
MSTKECPKCKSKDMVYEPWAGGQIWVCRNCGHRGVLVSERDD